MSAVGMDFGFDIARPVLRSAPAQARLKLTKRGRAVFTTLAAIPLVIAAVLFGLNGGGAEATLETAQPGVDYQYVTIEAGESLWAIAGEIAPSADPRDVISDILSFNGMASSEIFPGQSLAIPTKYAQ